MLTFSELICSVIITIALIVILVCLGGCSPIMEQRVDVSTLKPENALIVDVRPCEGLYFCYPWLSPHKIDFYRNKAGDMQVMPEGSNGQGLDALSSPVESAIGHFQWGLSPF